MTNATCTVKDCEDPAYCRDWCVKHYTHWRQHGDPLAGPFRKTIEERFWAKVNKTETCWLWTKGKNRRGYGRFAIGGNGTWRNVGAHRFAYELLVGPIPEGLTIDHVKERGCTSTSCVNPAHLEPVTMGENVLRGDTFQGRNARKTQCPQGHPYNGDNVRYRKNGARRCAVCYRDRARAYHNANRDLLNQRKRARRKLDR